MALSIHTNYASLVTQSTLSKTSNLLSGNQQRLGTGFRVNTAADDAAGLQIAVRLNAASRGMEVAIRNTGDATSLLQTGEGAFSEMTDIMARMKDLATQSANGTNSLADRQSLQGEFNELGNELANIIKNTSFAGERLFSDGTSVTGTGGKFSLAVNFQIGATTAEKLTFDASANLTNLTAALGTISANYNGMGPGTEIETEAGANGMIDTISGALNSIGQMRAKFGSNINRLNHTANNLTNMVANTKVAEGRIMDADFAKESANMSKNSMLMQSGISMLKQAGQMPGMVMSLLG